MLLVPHLTVCMALVPSRNFFPCLKGSLYQLLAESSGFKHLSMDSHSDKSYCDNEKFLFVHSTLPVSIINCQISELVIILRNPEHIIRSEFLQLVTLNSLDHIKEVKRNFE